MGKRGVVSAAALALACLLATACAETPSGSGNIVKDKKGLALNQQRLSVAVKDLNAVMDPSNAKQRDAHGQSAALSTVATSSSQLRTDHGHSPAQPLVRPIQKV